MPIYKIMLFGFISILSLLSVTCKKEITAVEDNTVPGRRNYVWTVDTLYLPYNTFYQIWGYDPKDIWVINSGDAERTIFHFNGQNWTTDDIGRPLVPGGIFGFRNDYVVIGGDGSIWKYDGNSWNEMSKLKLNGKNVRVNNIWGESENNYYAVGACGDEYGYYNNSAIAHYQNGYWSFQNTDGLHGLVAKLYRNNGDGVKYLLIAEWNRGTAYDSLLIYSYASEKYTQLYGGNWEYNQAADISLINGEVFFVMGKTIARKGGNNFYTYLSLDGMNFNNKIWGRASKDIFLDMTDGLAHYNGNDVEYLIHFGKPRTSIFDAALFEKEVFFLVYEASTNLNLIYHGKLE